MAALLLAAVGSLDVKASIAPADEARCQNTKCLDMCIRIGDQPAIKIFVHAADTGSVHAQILERRS